MMRQFDKPAIHESVFPERFIVEQYIGINDKNGVEIYKGDILRLKLNDYAGIENEPDIFIIDDEERFYSDICYLQQIRDRIEQYHTKDYIEIIGNIHDNPELIEKLA